MTTTPAAATPPTIAAAHEHRTRAADADFLRRLGREVRTARRNRNLTQEQLGHAAGISRNFTSSIERGAHGVDVLRLRRIAEALHLHPAALLDPPTARGQQVIHVAGNDQATWELAIVLPDGVTAVTVNVHDTIDGQPRERRYRLTRPTDDQPN